VRVDHLAVPLVDDGNVHQVRVLMGNPVPEVVPVPAPDPGRPGIPGGSVL
jgi:hypothetical protein